ncbi:MAG TPA: hypothetical protein VFX76_22890, partial [Roseiflexaceae bacterium]|nr:hypothetical protein [Roseiflexaceae bacterium]
MQNHEETEASARDEQTPPAEEQAPINQAPPAPLMPKSHRKRSRSKAGTAPALPDDEPLALPRGGLVAMRMSGGFRFSSQEIVVYRSGKIVYRQLAPASKLSLQTRQSPLSQLVELHVALNNSGMQRLMLPRGRQSGDAFAYEIVARIGRNVRTVEVFEGSIPESLAPLIRELK